MTFLRNYRLLYLFCFFLFLCSYCRARDEEGLAVCTALPVLRAGNANPRLQPAPRVLPVLDVRVHGRSLWSQCRIHRSVSSLAFPVCRHILLYLLNIYGDLIMSKNLCSLVFQICQVTFLWKSVRSCYFIHYFVLCIAVFIDLYVLWNFRF